MFPDGHELQLLQSQPQLPEPEFFDLYILKIIAAIMTIITAPTIYVPIIHYHPFADSGVLSFENYYLPNTALEPAETELLPPNPVYFCFLNNI